MKQTCSTNLCKHLKLLKQECNRLLTLHKNGEYVTPSDYSEYIKHKKYVTELLHEEKMAYYNKMLSKSNKIWWVVNIVNCRCQVKKINKTIKKFLTNNFFHCILLNL